jgi:zinc-ribbon domain
VSEAAPPNLALICPECGTQRPDPSRTCPACGAPPLRNANDKRTTEEEVRNEDLEPYVTLRYIALLFKLMAVLMLIMLVAEAVTGLMADGTKALLTLLGEGLKWLLIGGLVWSGGDVILMLIDAGHDLRVARILLGRINASLHEREKR